MPASLAILELATLIVATNMPAFLFVVTPTCAGVTWNPPLGAAHPAFPASQKGGTGGAPVPPPTVGIVKFSQLFTYPPDNTHWPVPLP